jgi:HSP20 family protein
MEDLIMTLVKASDRMFPTLPSFIDNFLSRAKYSNGILMVSIPKREEIKPKPAKQIDIM